MPRTELTPEEVLDIRTRNVRREGYTKISRIYNGRVSKSQVQQICRAWAWKEVDLVKGMALRHLKTGNIYKIQKVDLKVYVVSNGTTTKEVPKDVLFKSWEVISAYTVGLGESRSD